MKYFVSFFCSKNNNTFNFANGVFDSEVELTDFESINAFEEKVRQAVFDAGLRYDHISIIGFQKL
jgi:hypothetical protein